MPFIQIRDMDKIKNIVFKEKPVIIVGSISYEERCLAFFDVIKKLFSQEVKNQDIYAFKIIDDESQYRDQAREFTERNFRKLVENYTLDIKTINCGLMEEERAVKDLLDKINSQYDEGYNLFVDLSTLPRRFLLEILKKFRLSKKTEKITIFYSTPVSYQQPLLVRDLVVQDLLQGRSLGGSERIAIVSLGLNDTQLKICIEHIEPISSIIPIVPFPSTIVHEVLYRNDRHLKRWIDKVREFKYVHPYNPSLLVEILEKDIIKPYTNIKNVSFSLIPLSTKVQALAMFVYGINNNINIVYAQPRTYKVPYSYGYNKFFIYQISKDSIGGASSWLKIDSGILTGKFPK